MVVVRTWNVSNSCMVIKNMLSARSSFLDLRIACCSQERTKSIGTPHSRRYSRGRDASSRQWTCYERSPSRSGCPTPSTADSWIDLWWASVDHLNQRGYGTGQAWSRRGSLKKLHLTPPVRSLSVDYGRALVKATSYIGQEKGFTTSDNSLRGSYFGIQWIRWSLCWKSEEYFQEPVLVYHFQIITDL